MPHLGALLCEPQHQADLDVVTVVAEELHYVATTTKQGLRQTVPSKQYKNHAAEGASKWHEEGRS